MSGNFIVGTLMFIMGGFVALFIGQAIYMEIEGVRKHGWRFLCGSHYFDNDGADDGSDVTTTSKSIHSERRSDSGSPGSAIQANLVTFLASIGMCAVFFMPWISIMGLGVSGTTIGKIGDGGQAAWLILVLAVFSAALHLAMPQQDSPRHHGNLALCAIDLLCQQRAARLGRPSVRGFECGCLSAPHLRALPHFCTRQKYQMNHAWRLYDLTSWATVQCHGDGLHRDDDPQLLGSTPKQPAIHCR